MGWRDRDYARWTPDERRRFLGTSAPSRGPVVTSGVGLAAAVSALLFGLGHFPTGHPLVPALHFSLPSMKVKPRRSTSGSVSGTSARVELNGPRIVPVGSFLTFHGPVPLGDDGPVVVKGSFNRGAWRTLAVADGRSGNYLARIALNRRGSLRLRVIFKDGAEAIETITVR